MIESVTGFVSYFAGIRRRTLHYIRGIPAEQVDWAPRQGEYSCGDLVRHIAAAELMFSGAVAHGRWHYPGHGRKLAGSLEQLQALLEQTHLEALSRLRALDDSILHQPRPSLKGQPVSAWRLLLAMVEHEVHHRSQLAVYLALLGVEPPQIYGMGVEEVIVLAVDE